MLIAKPDDRPGEAPLKARLLDAIGAPAPIGQLQAILASANVIEAGSAQYPDVAVVLTDSATGLSQTARRLIAVAQAKTDVFGRSITHKETDIWADRTSRKHVSESCHAVSGTGALDKIRRRFTAVGG